MCGLYALFGPHTPNREELAFLDKWPGWQDRYRVPPSSLAPVIRQSPDGLYVADLLRWGLIPNWAKDETLARKLINARGETVAEKPSFRSAYRKRRCIVPASGFYEWQPVPGQKWEQPYFIRERDGTLMGMAGLWESWTNQSDGEILRTFCIVTIGANELMAPIHDRMPVILKKEDWKTWLNPEAEQSTIDGLVRPAEEETMEAWRVSRKVSDRGIEDGPELVTNVEAK